MAGRSSSLGVVVAGAAVAGRSSSLGVVVAGAAVALTTLLLYPLSEIAPAVSLGVLVPAGGPARLDGLGVAARARHEPRGGAGVQLLSHPADRPVHDRRRRELGRAGRVPGRRGRRVAPVRSGRARGRARPSAAAARPTSRRSWRGLLLGAPEPRAALPQAAKRIADALEVDSAAVVFERVGGDERQAAIAARHSSATLLVPAEPPRRSRASGSPRRSSRC